MNEDGYCFPVKGDNWICPDDYHDVDDDESGQCYPNEEGCNSYTIVNGERFDYILLTDRPDGKSDRCAKLGYLCEGEEEGETLPECKEYRKAVNSDDTMVNDIPPDGEGLFCDYPYHPGSCYDRNDNAGDFCLRYPEYTAFCKVIHICSWTVGDDIVEKQREVCDD